MKKRLATLLLLCSPLLTGCASSHPPTSLEGMRAMERQKLALQCFAEHEGERFLFGGQATFTACSRWARKVMEVRYPQAPVMVNTYQ